MLNFLRRKRAREDRPTPSVGEGVRVYAIGDIHGRLDLFEDLLDRIARDDRERAPLKSRLVLLGDLVDRGPSSAPMVDRAMQLASFDGAVRFIKGNHEEVFVAAARGDVRAAGLFRRIGGMETLASYGLDPARAAQVNDNDLARWMLAHIPRAHVDFLDDFEDMLTIGDYLFVHAGIRPRVPLDRQDPADLHWIRGNFLKHGGDHGYVIVHGHSISDEVDEQANRIGIDTGAWRSGRLTALALEGRDRWFLQT
ncbi:MAG TPA: metallophosphoesterase [Sphingobium sp.]|nr:metallophosphoesterase [Sphingobium sp.]